MSDILTSGPLKFTEPNCPTRAGEIINTISEIYDIPNPREGMSVFVRDEKKNYTILSLKDKIISGVLVPHAVVDKYVSVDRLLEDTRANAANVNTIEVKKGLSHVAVVGKAFGGGDFEAVIPAATTDTAGVMSAADKQKLDAELPTALIYNEPVEMDRYINVGIYNFSNVYIAQNSPILNAGRVSGKLVVLVTDDTNNHVVTQVLSLNNNEGGEGNVYIRSQQNGTWKPWGKLQTNIEVGQVNTLDNLTDNGIYSGVWTDGTSSAFGTYYDTFVLIVINNYSVAGGTGTAHCISQLKYSLNLGGPIDISKRVSTDGGNSWGEWQGIGDIPIATKDRVGLVRMGTAMGVNDLGQISPILGSGLAGNDGDIVLKAVQSPSASAADKVYFTMDTSAWGCIQYNTNFFCAEMSVSGERRNVLNLSERTIKGIALGTGLRDLNNMRTEGSWYMYGENNGSYNLPITQNYSGASVSMKVTNVDSSLRPSDGSVPTEKCITQYLQLSNRMGGEGNIYVRTYNENNNGLNGWTSWKKLQGMVESYINTDGSGVTPARETTTGLNGMIDNGMYSGIYTDDITLASPTFVETFVLVVINDYAVSSQAGTPRRISQLKYATDTLTGQCTVKKRIGTGDDTISWSVWEEIGSGGGKYVLDIRNGNYSTSSLIPLLKNAGIPVDAVNVTVLGTGCSDFVPICRHLDKCEYASFETNLHILGTSVKGEMIVYSKESPYYIDARLEIESIGGTDGSKIEFKLKSGKFIRTSPRLRTYAYPEEIPEFISIGSGIDSSYFISTYSNSNNPDEIDNITDKVGYVQYLGSNICRLTGRENTDETTPYFSRLLVQKAYDGVSSVVRLGTFYN